MCVPTSERYSWRRFACLITNRKFSAFFILETKEKRQLVDAVLGRTWTGRRAGAKTDRKTCVQWNEIERMDGGDGATCTMHPPVALYRTAC